MMGEILLEEKILKEIALSLEAGKKGALVAIIDNQGSSPRKKGTVMGIFEEKPPIGTIGGGDLEKEIIRQAKELLEIGESKKIEYQLKEDTPLNMLCGGTLEIFIKVFEPKPKLLIVGLGHVGKAIYQIASNLEFELILFDDREEIFETDEFENTSEIFKADFLEVLRKYIPNNESYVVIASRNHKMDLESLEAVVQKDYTYIGMMGSKKKSVEILKKLKEKGIKDENLQKVYTPIGLDIASQEPTEIAISIIAQILMIKNKRTGKVLKEVKK